MKIFTRILLPGFLLIQLCFVPASGGNLPSHPSNFFTENKGQITDQNGVQRNDVLFMYEDGGFKLILKNSGFSYEWTKVLPDNEESTESGSLPQSLEEEEDEVIPEIHLLSKRVDVDFINCNSNVTVSGENMTS